MSVGTIVTIVLLMSVLVLGLFLVQRVFSSGTSAIDSIDTQVQNEIQKLFSDQGVSLAIYPNSREITLKAGDTPKGFAFSIRNNDVESHKYKYSVFAQEGFDYSSRCGSTMTRERADSFILLSEGTINLGPGGTLDIPELVRFSIPEVAPPCTMPYKLEISYDDPNNRGPFQAATVYVTIK